MTDSNPLVLALSETEHGQLTAAAARAGTTAEAYALDAVIAAAQEHQTFGCPTTALELDGPVFGLDPAENERKVNALRRRTSWTRPGSHGS